MRGGRAAKHFSLKNSERTNFYDAYLPPDNSLVKSYLKHSVVKLSSPRAYTVQRSHPGPFRFMHMTHDCRESACDRYSIASKYPKRFENILSSSHYSGIENLNKFLAKDSLDKADKIIKTAGKCSIRIPSSAKTIKEVCCIQPVLIHFRDSGKSDQSDIC